jgi:hypothetical protein
MARGNCDVSFTFSSAPFYEFLAFDTPGLKGWRYRGVHLSLKLYLNTQDELYDLSSWNQVSSTDILIIE